jgi:hypothetical protein
LIAYAGLYCDGLYKTVDGGQSWFYSGFGECINGGDIALAPPDPSTVYVAGYSNVWLSRDAGATWTRISHDFCAGTPQSADVDPLDPDTAIVGMNSCGVYVTHDAGVTWTNSQNGLTRTEMPAVVYSPDGTVVYAGNGYAGVYQSLDGGLTWSPINQGLTDPDVLDLETVASTSTLWGGFLSEGVGVRKIP